METFENARDNRKAAQQLLAEALYLAGGRAGLNSEQKLAVMQASRERIAASLVFADKAIAILEKQATSEVPEVTDEELQKLLQSPE